MPFFARTSRFSVGQSTELAFRALRGWTLRQIAVAFVSSVAIAALIGVATVLIPNQIFARDIPPVWWHYPVWLITSALTGMLVATYVRNRSAHTGVDTTSEKNEQRTTRMGMAGGVLVWFAVGCPVCNKLALLALGYSGAITWFAPVQPLLAVGALILVGVALVWRLRGQIACPVRTKETAAQ